MAFISGIKLFENKKVRSKYDPDKETWYFSIVVIVDVFNWPAKFGQSQKLLIGVEKQTKKRMDVSRLQTSTNWNFNLMLGNFTKQM